jgi:hypothetical protein
MLFELIAAIAAGFAGGGIALLITKVSGGRLPRWIIPLAAGAAMIGMAIFNEYDWYPRTVASMGDGLEVASTVQDRAPFRPWTYLVPFVTRFLAVDTGTMQTNDAVKGQRIVEVYAFGRWAPTRKIDVAVDCTGGRRADLTPGISFGPDGTIEGANWRDVGADDPIVRTACGA